MTVLFFSFQSPELVDRWLWLPFLLALCFRWRGVRGTARSTRQGGWPGPSPGASGPP